ncbi:MAG: (2Fe-2S)-binding protein [Deltaproteobacteria bacterium]|nr:(2Fe-2S)-binding protein [Deltaproteobacteria bacterium]
MTKLITLTIDGHPVEVPEGTTIFNAAKQLALEIPHFCYHPKLSIAGNCRLCQVEVEGARGPVISCRETVREGMVVRVNSEKAKQVRKDVLEFILINHPLDCPICDQSGECKLQDQYFNHSVQPSRMHLPKVHKPKAKPIGPQVMLDDERCVMCTRCIRFCDEIAGEHQLIMRERGDHSTIDVFPGKQLDHPYSLCTVDICPVGALTSSDFRFKKRVWFLNSTPSICTGCATGCNIWMDHHDRIVYRYRPRDNEAVNQCWLCDPGRMTYKAINAATRALFPMKLVGGAYQRLEWNDALSQVKEVLKSYKAADVVGVLSAQASNEENTAVKRFLEKTFPGLQLFWTGREAMPEFADKILRDADRNPNTHGVQALTTKRLDAQVKAKVLIVLGELTAQDLRLLMSIKPEVTIALADQLPHPEWAHYLLPRATHAEQDGTYVNRKGMEQQAKMAFPPKGESLSAVAIASKLMEIF